MTRLSLLLFLLLAGSQFPAIAADAVSPKRGLQGRAEGSRVQVCVGQETLCRGIDLQRPHAMFAGRKGGTRQGIGRGKTKTGRGYQAAPSAAACADCGQVVGVLMQTKKGKGGALGTIGGGVAGALLGHQVGGGTGKDVATIAGAAGGAYAGYKAEEKLRSTKTWSVTVKMDNGEQRVIEFDHEPGVKSGDLVKVSGNTITRR